MPGLIGNFAFIIAFDPAFDPAFDLDQNVTGEEHLFFPPCLNPVLALFGE
jgi:hypothetical protein